MSSEIFALLFIFGFLVLIVIGIFLIAYLAAQSRKKKQKKILDSLPSQVEFYAFVRFNRGNQQNKILKLKAFQGSGILYVQDGQVIFKSTTQFNHSFDFRNSKIVWEGENLANGLLKWFSLQDSQEKLYLNVETGMFIFHTGGSNPTTRSIYEELLVQQSRLE